MPFRLMSVVTINGGKQKSKAPVVHLGDNMQVQINIELDNGSDKNSQRSNH